MHYTVCTFHLNQLQMSPEFGYSAVVQFHIRPMLIMSRCVVTFIYSTLFYIQHYIMNMDMVTSIHHKWGWGIENQTVLHFGI